jgi:hypothetical protein
MWLNALKCLSEAYSLLILFTVSAFAEGPLGYSMLPMQISPQCAALLHLKRALKLTLKYAGNC